MKIAALIGAAFFAVALATPAQANCHRSTTFEACVKCLGPSTGATGGYAWCSRKWQGPKTSVVPVSGKKKK